ncbi:unnamed protein product [Schistocephalus solidus]|uniref:Secreted protein n=1 Tax=Schistocephalus solidus TaxID=70667 RepID=A0A183TA80_SCHSO|nr:unnamed protein product [Schistocephalus solidus]
MLLWPPLTGTQLSPLAPQSRLLPSGHTPGNRHDRRAKQRVSGVVCANTPGTQPRQPPASSPASGLLDSVLTKPAAPATCALSHLRSS